MICVNMERLLSLVEAAAAAAADDAANLRCLSIAFQCVAERR